MDYSQGLEAIERELVRSQSLAALGEKLRGLVSLDGEAKSLETRIAKAKDELADVEPKVAEALAGVQAAQDQAMGIVGSAEAKATAMLHEADEKAAAKTAAATVEADRLVAEAKGRARSLVDTALQAKAAADIDAKTARLEAETALADRDAALREIDLITARIAKAKEAAAEMLK